MVDITACWNRQAFPNTLRTINFPGTISFLWDTSIVENFIINVLCLTTVDKLPMFEENPCENNSRKYHNYSHCRNSWFWWSNAMYLSYSNDFYEEYQVLSFGPCIHCGLLVCNWSSHYSHADIFVGFVNSLIIRLNALKHEVMLDFGTIPLTTTNSHNPLLSYFVTVIPSMAIRDICIWKKITSVWCVDNANPECNECSCTFPSYKLINVTLLNGINYDSVSFVNLSVRILLSAIRLHVNWQTWITFKNVHLGNCMYVSIPNYIVCKS